MKKAIELIAEERERQINVEGWTADHDAKHDNEELAIAAAAYCCASPLRNQYRPDRVSAKACMPAFWPWHPDWFKPTPDDRIRELVKAGALIVAEIDRLQNHPDHERKEAN